MDDSVERRQSEGIGIEGEEGEIREKRKGREKKN